jgi:DNA-binding MarR family transcriptional regulator
MSTPAPVPRTPLIALVHRANRALQLDMVRAAHERGFEGAKNSHNVLFATLTTEGARSVDLAAQTGMTRQSMGEVVRDLVGLGILEMVPDPRDRRAKLVRYTDEGLAVARRGFEHIVELEESFGEEFGEDYEAARRVLERVADILETHDQP